MIKILLGLVIAILGGCSVRQSDSACVGSSDLPPALASEFTVVSDDSFLRSSLGKTNEGKLCQGLVYRSKNESQVVVYRAWNSTNANSKYGHWWAFNIPSGKIAKYRENYEICYQWSPLDKMIQCKLKPGTKIVVGNGQSAVCSEYLRYEISKAQQVYISDAANSVFDCSEYDGTMNWEPASISQ